MTICPVVAELFHVDRRTDYYLHRKVTVAFCNFANVPKKAKVLFCNFANVHKKKAKV